MSEVCKSFGFDPRTIIFKKRWEGSGKGKGTNTAARGGESLLRLALNGLEHKAHAKRKGQLARPFGSARRETPCLVPHMAFLPRREGGEALMLLNKSSKRAKRKRGPVVVDNIKFNRFF